MSEQRGLEESCCLLPLARISPTESLHPHPHCTTGCPRAAAAVPVPSSSRPFASIRVNLCVQVNRHGDKRAVVVNTRTTSASAQSFLDLSTRIEHPESRIKHGESLSKKVKPPRRRFALTRLLIELISLRLCKCLGKIQLYNAYSA